MTPLTILYEDEHLVAINKPAGMLVHAGRDPEGPEWIAMKRLRDQLGRRVFTVHRLDRPTSGVLLFALDKETSGLAQKEFEQRRVTKTYLALVCGAFPATWTCETPLQSEEGQPFRDATTRFRCLGTGPALTDPSIEISLVEAAPLTGRYHQIRRHLLEAGFPIIGDFLYGEVDQSLELGERLGIGTRMLLQAKVLELRHPHTGMPLRIEADEDAEFLRIFASQPAGWEKR